MADTRARTYETLGILMKFHAFPGDTLGKYCLVEAVVPPGLGAPPNHHAGETEAFYVLEGEVEFMVAGETRVAGPGSHVPIPDGAVHAFTARGTTPARVLILNAPGHMHERFFTELGTPVAEGTAAPAPMDGPPDVAKVMQVAGATGMTILPPPA
ncbi:cupin domain-containing protein [Stappia indica]|uniref:cupin domain-containing protein n=1 Tax=Stappia indica TaxID=538381 RepID=UPI000831327C|nr:cupin domain-containing protein [Stappia indica]